jgi:hypothetical protein
VTAGYRVHGASIASEVVLPEPPEPVTGHPDLAIVHGPPLPIEVLAPNTAQLRFVQDDALRYEGCERDGTWMLQFPRLARFVVNGTVMTAHASPDVAPGTLELLLAGAGLSFAFAVRGDLVLHASAITHDGGCIAFVGDSGQGKTTLAALAAGAGFGFFADDVLRLDLGGVVRAHRGASEARLRTNPSDLGLGDVPVRTTIDNRFAVSLGRSEDARAPLVALVLPRLHHGAGPVEARRLDAEQAFTVLLGSVRIMGWTHAAVLQDQFQAVARVAAEVPMVEVDLPWNVPPPASLGREVLDRVRECVERRPVAT